MNRLLTLTLLLLTSFQLNAQGLSAGLRANAGYQWQLKKDQPDFIIKVNDFENQFVRPEVFVRYETKKHWAFEASYSHSRYHRPDMYGPVYDAPYDTVIITSKGIAHDLMITLQYEIGRLPKGGSPALRKFHHYVGLSTGLFLLRGETAFYPDYAPNTADMVFKEVENGIWAGGNYALFYDFGKRFRLTGNAYCKLRVGNQDFASIVYGYRQPTAQVGLQLGVAYRIF